MCASCGCGTFNDNHGDERNITLDQLQRAADAANISLGEVGDNLADATLDDDSAGEDNASEAKSTAKPASR